MQLKIADHIVGDSDPVLRGKAKHVAKADIEKAEIRKLIERMRRLLAKEKNGVGLAAPQVRVPLMIFIVAGRVFEEDGESEGNTLKQGTALKESPSDSPHPQDKVFINPELIRSSRKKSEMSEGCLSVRGTYGTVLRSEKATVRALDEHGKPFTMNGSGLLAQIFQHETDHLNGVLFIDKASSLEDEKNIKNQKSKIKSSA